MMGSTGGGPLRRRNERLKTRPEANGGTSSLFGPGGAAPSFATEMAVVGQTPASGGASGRAVLSETMTLAKAGGGTASLQLTIGRGERVDLRVTVRSGMVTVLARVDSGAGERAVESCRERIAQTLGEAGLRLGRFFVRRSEGNGNPAAMERRQGSRRRRNREEERP